MVVSQTYTATNVSAHLCVSNVCFSCCYSSADCSSVITISMDTSQQSELFLSLIPEYTCAKKTTEACPWTRHRRLLLAANAKTDRAIPRAYAILVWQSPSCLRLAAKTPSGIVGTRGGRQSVLCDIRGRGNCVDGWIVVHMRRQSEKFLICGWGWELRLFCCEWGCT